MPIATLVVDLRPKCTGRMDVSKESFGRLDGIVMVGDKIVMLIALGWVEASTSAVLCGTCGWGKYIGIVIAYNDQTSYNEAESRVRRHTRG